MNSVRILAVALLFAPVLAEAQPTPLADAARRQALAMTPASQAEEPVTQPARNWSARHPVLLGTLIGLSVGAPIGAATCKYPGAEGNCSYHTYPGNARTLGALTIGGIGAGIGAAVGALVDAFE